MKTLKYLLLLSLYYSTNLFSAESYIPLAREARLPSNDLVFDGKVISSKEAIDLKGVDLSNLQPIANEIYDGENHLLDDDQNIAIENNQQVSFQGTLLSNSGLLRFNAIDDRSGNVITVHLDKTIHSMLLRKNLLRRLGYVIPTMKHLSTISVKFDSLNEKNEFLNKVIPENTLGSKERWLVSEKELEIVLQDVVVTIPDESDFYNVAMGVPAGTINSRTIRALAIAYNLIDLSESVNQFSYAAAKIDNKALVLSHFTGNEFNSSIDDIVWMQKKIALLSREDIKLIVELSKFPNGIKDLLVEKIISRRNSLNELLGIKAQALSVNKKLTISPNIKEGKVLEVDFKGYASRFSYGDAITPLDQIQYYLYSKIQSNIIDNGISYINKYIEAYDLSEKRNEYFKNQFETGLKHFIETGELLPIKVGTWTSPIANLRFILSRDIVIGSFLGTDNLVQLADTFGAGINLGLMVGIEGLPNGAGASVSGTASLVRTYTHLKPVKTLKASLKEPYKNIFVPLLKKSLKDDYLTLSELKNFEGKDEERTKKVQEVMKEIDLNLGVGESLILTDRIMPTVSFDLNYNQGVIGAGVGVSGSVAVIKRIHFYKKAPQVLQIFDDKGRVKTLDLSLSLNAVGVPFLKVSQTFDRGAYHVKSYMVNLDTSVEENPNLYSNALAIYEVLKNKNFEILNAATKPISLNATTKVKTTGLSFLLWKMEKSKGQHFYDVEAKDGVKEKYFTYQKDFLSGTNVESMTKKLVYYYISEKVTPEISITDEDDANPGETFYGKSKNETFRYETSVNEIGKHEKKFLSMSDIRQGWTFNEKSLAKYVDKVNKKFNLNLFNKDLIDFKKLKLYKIGFHLNLYEAGIARLASISKGEIEKLQSKYRAEAACAADDTNYNNRICGDLGLLISKVNQCAKEKLDETKRAICQTELFEKMIEDVKFDDFKKLIGENNFYLYGTVDGFRKGSEVLNDTIYSNSYGKIGSQYWNGPMEVVRSMVGITEGEFTGAWL